MTCVPLKWFIWRCPDHGRPCEIWARTQKFQTDRSEIFSNYFGKKYTSFPHQFHIRRGGISQTIRKAWPVPAAFCRNPKNSNALNYNSIIPTKRVFVMFQHKKFYGNSSMLDWTNLIWKRKRWSALDFSGFTEMKRLETPLRSFFENKLKGSFFTKVLSSIADHGSEESFFSSRRKVI